MGILLLPTDQVEVADDEGNTLFLKAALDISTRTAVFATVRSLFPGPSPAPEMIWGYALLIHMAVNWHGPALSMPFSVANLKMLRADSQLFIRALEKIAEITAQAGQVGATSPVNFQTPATGK